MRTVKTLTTVSLATAALCALFVGACGGDSTTSTSGDTGGSTSSTGGGTDNSGGSGGSLFGSGGDTTSSGGDTTGSSGGTSGSGGTHDGGPLTDAQAGSGGADAAIVDGSSPADGQAGADAGHRDAGKPCGNGVVDPGEDCDPGAGNTAACTPLCKWLCSPGSAGDTFCDDHLLCDGTEKCSTDHVCVPGTKATDGTSCGGGNVCKSGLCASSSCGDGVRSGTEECDDGNQINGDGCNTDCTFSCLSTDSARDCSAQQTACVSAITCNDGTHTCSTPTKKPDNTTCGTHAYCKTGVCTASVCGNGTVEPTEICDDGNKVDGDGCNSDCTFSCVAPNSDCAAAPSCEKQTCTAAHTCKPVADTSKDDTSCGTNKVCSNGGCVSACGNGVVDSGEQCDDGNQVNGDGCDSCKFSCSNAATDCKTTAPACDKWTCNANSHVCEAVADSTKNDTACGSGLVCNNTGGCVASCGNGQVDAGEQCDDGNNVNGDGCQTTCKFSCSTPAADCTGNAGACEKWSCNASHVCASVADTGQNGQSCGSGQVCAAGACGASCGNGTVDAGEQCDDGNKVSGDGCENNCKFSCSNPTTDCTPTPCQTTSCSGAHICQTAADSSQNDKACGSGLVCSAGACIAACGNSIVDGADGEQCDDGNKVNGDGCNNNCTFSCSNPVNDCAAPAVCMIATCSAGHTCQTGPDASQNDQACAAGKVCSAGSCITACGNSLVDAGEQCDDGNQTNGDGCDNDCTFSCVTPATDCPAAPACQKESCTAGHTCQATADSSKDDQTCGTNQVCSGGACVSSCGNGIVDPGEQCDPPNTATCDANCQNQCDPDGSWASLLNVAVTWPASGIYLTKGSGTIKVWSLITTSNAGTTNTVLPCNITVPGFSSIAASYTITFPNSLFDHAPPFLTAATMNASFSTLKAGATYATTAPFTSLIGMTAPATGAWPAVAGLTTADQDADTRLGITANTNAPTSITGPTADHIDLALRQTTALNGTLTDCTHLSGSATVSHQDSHVLGCTTPKGGGGENTCNATQSGFLDTHRPIYVPGASTFSAVKMANAATCANVRAAFP